jgi:hypothetical protein
MRRWRRRGTAQPERIGGWKRSTLAAHGARVRALVAAQPDLTIAELQSRLAAAGIAVSRSSVGRFLIATGLTQKKTQHAAGHDRPDVAAARLAWRAGQPEPSPERLGLIDETCASTAMARRYGRQANQRAGHQQLARPGAAGSLNRAQPGCLSVTHEPRLAAQRGGSGAYGPTRLREAARGRIPLARAARACRRLKRAPPVAGFDGLSTVAPLQIPECEVTRATS